MITVSTSVSQIPPQDDLVDKVSNIESQLKVQQNQEDYDDVFISPLLEEIPTFPLPPDLKTPKFEMLSGKKD